MNHYGLIFLIVMSYLAAFWAGAIIFSGENGEGLSSLVIGLLAGIGHLVAAGFIIYAMLGGFGFLS